MNKSKQSTVYLDEYEQGIEDSFARGEWKSVDNLAEEKAKAKMAARNYFRKDKTINIRLSSADLTNIKIIAAQEGLPYQSLIGSILHKFSTGQLNR